MRSINGIAAAKNLAHAPGIAIRKKLSVAPAVASSRQKKLKTRMRDRIATTACAPASIRTTTDRKWRVFRRRFA
jgi:hypothetical protein